MTNPEKEKGETIAKGETGFSEKQLDICVETGSSKKSNSKTIFKKKPKK